MYKGNNIGKRFLRRNEKRMQYKTGYFKNNIYNNAFIFITDSPVHTGEYIFINQINYMIQIDQIIYNTKNGTVYLISNDLKKYYMKEKIKEA